MSLINDALRRASSIARGTNVPPPAPPPVAGPERAHENSEPPLRRPASAFPALPPRVEDGEEPVGRKSKWPLMLTTVLVLAVGLAAAMKYLQKRNQEQPVVVSATAGRKEFLPHAAAMQTAAQTLAAVTNRAAAATTVAPSDVAAAPVLAVAPSSAPKFPPLRLQSIFYRPSNPSVMINGRTLFLDDEVQGVTVADIQPSSVTLVLSGHTNVLTLR